MKNECLDIGIIQAFMDGELAHDHSARVSGQIAPCDSCGLMLADAASDQMLAAVDIASSPNLRLAGALARPAFVMLPFAADWRWRTARTDSPWYPTLRLFRQEAPGDWESVVASVAGAIGTLTRSR